MKGEYLRKKVTSAICFLVLFFLISPLCRISQAFDKNSFFYIVEAQILGGYSEISGKDGIGSVLADWLVSPALKLQKNLTWVTLYSGSYERGAQVVTQEEGGRETQTTQDHSLSSFLKYDLTDRWFLKPIFFVDWVFVNETKDESFGDGLYDYRDLGGGLESVWTTFSSAEREDQARLGFQLFKREYPNYQSLLFLFDPNGSPEVDEKDFDGYRANLSFNRRMKGSWSGGLEIISLYKDFTDKRTIDENGVRSATNTREDFVQYLNGHLSHPLTRELSFRLDGQFVANFSNLDFYATHQTLSLSDDDFVKDYFDYFAFTVRPSLSYSVKMSEDKTLVISGSYALNVLHYPGRPAQDAQGRYKEEDQEDLNHSFTVRSSVPLTKQVSWVTVLNYTLASSNQDFDAFYLYSYDRWSALTGVSFKY